MNELRGDSVAQAQAFLASLAVNGTARDGVVPGGAAEQCEDPPIAFESLPRPMRDEDALGLFRSDAPFRLSVVLPACNERLLQRTVEQFRATLPARSEIIVVDNGSSDGCADFLAGPDVAPAAERALPFKLDDVSDGVTISLLRYPRPLGVAGARNRGLEHARGEVIVFADAHVDVPPGWWPPMVEALARPGVGIVGPAFGIMGSPEHGKSYGQRIADVRLRGEWLACRGDDPYPVPALGGGFMALRYEVLQATGGFDAGMTQWGSEDLEICLRLWLLGYEVWVVPEVEIPHLFRQANPYQVEPEHVVHNLLRTAFLHLNGASLTHFLHAMADHPQYARAMAMCAESDVWRRRDELRARRVHDDAWLFHHPYFADIPMELRDVTSEEPPSPGPALEQGPERREHVASEREHALIG